MDLFEQCFVGVGGSALVGIPGVFLPPHGAFLLLPLDLPILLPASLAFAACLDIATVEAFPHERFRLLARVLALGGA